MLSSDMHELASSSERKSSELISHSDGSKPSESRRRSTGDDNTVEVPHQRLELHATYDLEVLVPQPSFFCLLSLSDRFGERERAPRPLH